MNALGHRFSRLIAIVAATFLVCYGTAMASEYYAVGKYEAVYLAWTQDAEGHLQGQVEIVSVDSTQSTELKTKSAAFTGIRSGSDVSLSFGILTAFGGTTWTGHVGWNELSLILPTNGAPQQFVLRAGSFAQFQEAANKLQGGVAANQQRAANEKAVNDRNAAIERAYVEALNCPSSTT